VIGQFAPEDALRPIIVKTHVPAAGKQEGGGSQPRQGNHAEKKNESEEIVNWAK
jgi:hypothetical protein